MKLICTPRILFLAWINFYWIGDGNSSPISTAQTNGNCNYLQQPTPYNDAIAKNNENERRTSESVSLPVNPHLTNADRARVKSYGRTYSHYEHRSQSVGYFGHENIHVVREPTPEGAQPHSNSRRTRQLQHNQNSNVGTYAHQPSWKYKPAKHSNQYPHQSQGGTTGQQSGHSWSGGHGPTQYPQGGATNQWTSPIPAVQTNWQPTVTHSNSPSVGYSGKDVYPKDTTKMTTQTGQTLGAQNQKDVYGRKVGYQGAQSGYSLTAKPSHWPTGATTQPGVHSQHQPVTGYSWPATGVQNGFTQQVQPSPHVLPASGIQPGSQGRQLPTGVYQGGQGIFRQTAQMPQSVQPPPQVSSGSVIQPGISGQQIPTSGYQGVQGIFRQTAQTPQTLSSAPGQAGFTYGTGIQPSIQNQQLPIGGNQDARNQLPPDLRQTGASSQTGRTTGTGNQPGLTSGTSTQPYLPSGAAVQTDLASGSGINQDFGSHHYPVGGTTDIQSAATSGLTSGTIQSPINPFDQSGGGFVANGQFGSSDTRIGATYSAQLPTFSDRTTPYFGSRGTDRQTAQQNLGGSSTFSKIKYENRKAHADASAHGSFGDAQAQTNVQGGASHDGSFQAQAQSGFSHGSVQSQVQGRNKKASSTGSSQVRGVAQSTTQAQLGYEDKMAEATAQGSSGQGSYTSVVQSQKRKGQASSQAQGTGQTSSNAQVGLDEDDVQKQENTTNGDQQEVSATAQGGGIYGQSQTQVQGGGSVSASAQSSFGDNPDGIINSSINPVATFYPRNDSSIRSRNQTYADLTGGSYGTMGMDNLGSSTLQAGHYPIQLNASYDDNAANLRPPTSYITGQSTTDIQDQSTISGTSYPSLQATSQTNFGTPNGRNQSFGLGPTLVSGTQGQLAVSENTSPNRQYTGTGWPQRQGQYPAVQSVPQDQPTFTSDTNLIANDDGSRTLPIRVQSQIQAENNRSLSTPATQISQQFPLQTSSFDTVNTRYTTQSVPGQQPAHSIQQQYQQQQPSQNHQQPIQPQSPFQQAHQPFLQANQQPQHTYQYQLPPQKPQYHFQQTQQPIQPQHSSQQPQQPYQKHQHFQQTQQPILPQHNPQQAQQQPLLQPQQPFQQPQQPFQQLQPFQQPQQPYQNQQPSQKPKHHFQQPQQPFLQPQRPFLQAQQPQINQQTQQPQTNQQAQQPQQPFQHQQPSQKHQYFQQTKQPIQSQHPSQQAQQPFQQPQKQQQPIQPFQQPQPSQKRQHFQQTQQPIQSQHPSQQAQQPFQQPQKQQQPQQPFLQSQQPIPHPQQPVKHYFQHNKQPIQHHQIQTPYQSLPSQKTRQADMTHKMYQLPYQVTPQIQPSSKSIPTPHQNSFSLSHPNDKHIMPQQDKIMPHKMYQIPYQLTPQLHTRNQAHLHSTKTQMLNQNIHDQTHLDSNVKHNGQHHPILPTQIHQPEQTQPLQQNIHSPQQPQLLTDYQQQLDHQNIQTEVQKQTQDHNIHKPKVYQQYPPGYKSPQKGQIFQHDHKTLHSSQDGYQVQQGNLATQNTQQVTQNQQQVSQGQQTINSATQSYALQNGQHMQPNVQVSPLTHQAGGNFQDKPTSEQQTFQTRKYFKSVPQISSVIPPSHIATAVQPPAQGYQNKQMSQIKTRSTDQTLHSQKMDHQQSMPSAHHYAAKSDYLQRLKDGLSNTKSSVPVDAPHNSPGGHNNLHHGNPINPTYFNYEPQHSQQMQNRTPKSKNTAIKDVLCKEIQCFTVYKNNQPFKKCEIISKKC